MLREEYEEIKKQVGASLHLCLFYQNLNLNLSKAALLRLMYSVANGAGSFEGRAESHHNDSHSFPLKGQLSQIEALWKEPNLVKWTHPCHFCLFPSHLRSWCSFEGSYSNFWVLNVAETLATFCSTMNMDFPLLQELQDDDWEQLMG